MRGTVVTDESIMTFGKHVGRMVKHVPGEYLLWLADQQGFAKQHPELSTYIEKYRHILELEAEGK